MSPSVPALDHPLDRAYRGAVDERVPAHQDACAFGGHRGQVVGHHARWRQRLLDEHVLACLKRLRRPARSGYAPEWR